MKLPCEVYCDHKWSRRTRDVVEARKKEKEKVRKSSATAEEAEMESRFHEAPWLKHVYTGILHLQNWIVVEGLG